MSEYGKCAHRGMVMSFYKHDVEQLLGNLAEQDDRGNLSRGRIRRVSPTGSWTSSGNEDTRDAIRPEANEPIRIEPARVKPVEIQPADRLESVAESGASDDEQAMRCIFERIAGAAPQPGTSRGEESKGEISGSLFARTRRESGEG